jgi:hypothetical protein
VIRRNDPNSLLPIPTLSEEGERCPFACQDSVRDQLLNRSTASVAERLQKLFSLLNMVLLLFKSVTEPVLVLSFFDAAKT